MRRASGWVTALALLILAAGPVTADEQKQHCKQGCQEELRSCKSDCQVERDSGDGQQTERYGNCDAGCHSTYDSCKDDCEGDE